MKELRVLYVRPSAEAFVSFASELDDAGLVTKHIGDELQVECDGMALRFAHSSDASSVRRRLAYEYVSFVLVDARPTAAYPSIEAIRPGIDALMTELDYASDVELRYGFHRIGVLVSNESNDALEALLLSLGGWGVRFAWRAQSGESGFLRRVVGAMSNLIRDRNVGKKALCLSGGGTTGIYFELGVLKCLQDCLPEGALNEMDMYFGISAGAVVGSMLAVGYSIDDAMAAISGESETRLPPFDLRLVRRRNYSLELMKRSLRRATRRGTQSVSRLLGRRRATSLAPEYPSIWAPPFMADELERYLKAAFETPGATNRFDHLDRELYIGATDLDTRQHTLFGSKDAPATTISKAVQASVSFNPVFGPVQIGDRFFEDGAVTRTSNMSESIERGATLVLIVDPFVPRVSREPGVHVERSLFYHVDQNIRTMSFTRFANARKWLLRRHPEVSFYSFLPSNRLRHLLSDNPMDHRAFEKIWRGAYLSTLARIERCGPKLIGDLAAHGLHVDLERARVVADRLESIEHPSLADFYPERRLENRSSELTLDRQRRLQFSS